MLQIAGDLSLAARDVEPLQPRAVLRDRGHPVVAEAHAAREVEDAQATAKIQVGRQFTDHVAHHRQLHERLMRGRARVSTFEYYVPGHGSVQFPRRLRRIRSGAQLHYAEHYDAL